MDITQTAEYNRIAKMQIPRIGSEHSYASRSAARFNPAAMLTISPEGLEAAKNAPRTSMNLIMTNLIKD